MMMAHIQGEKVVNVSLWDGVTEWQPNENVVEIPEGSSAGIGWGYVDGEFIAPPEEGEAPEQEL
jgi:hypothetical protein